MCFLVVSLQWLLLIVSLPPVTYSGIEEAPLLTLPRPEKRPLARQEIAEALISEGHDWSTGDARTRHYAGYKLRKQHVSRMFEEEAGANLRRYDPSASVQSSASELFVPYLRTDSLLRS